MRTHQRWFNQTQGLELPLKISVATGFRQRLVGLISHSSISTEEALFFPSCNSIHTFFMSFKIDCVFFDRQLRVVDIVESLAPNKILWPRFNANSVLEMSSGQVRNLPFRIGDQFHVSH